MKNKSALDYAKLGAAALMDKFTPEELPPVKRFHYHQGVFLAGVERVYRLTKDEKYYNYIKEWVDINIDQNGDSQTYASTVFDDIQPGILLFNLYHTTGDERYKIMMDRMNRNIEMWPTNAKGGFWHMKFRDNQMWLDTMYMMGVFAAMYAKEFDHPYMFEKIYTQAKLMYTYMLNPETGLLYHMWDDSKAEEAVDKETGLIKVSWGRAVGWYVVAIAEILEYLPEDHPLRTELTGFETKLLTALVKYQDKETGLWYQVLDMPGDPRNWTESSCTALFTYAMVKCLNLGIIDEEFRENAILGYKGAVSKTEIRDGALIMKDICIGTGFGEVEYYFDRPTSENDLHGVGAFLLMATEIYKMEEELM
jgi:unsaturated rhamnogalacturonyl hydrolase